MANKRKIAIIGLGYVGLPVAFAFAEHFDVIGYDIDKKRIQDLKEGTDLNGEIPASILKSKKILFTHDPNELQSANVYIVTVPTPIDNAHKPDLCWLHLACETLGKVLKKNDIIIFESTVYPGAIEETCIPMIEKVSSKKANSDFGVGYSPERINPGDQTHTFQNVTKIISALNEQTLKSMQEMYGKIAKTILCASSIKVAEAAKVIENTQRDLNIALMNELAMIFNKMGIDTQEVIECAKTKWNFYPVWPGLVGGHCIGVDPYYLTYKAKQIGYRPEVILAGRRINDGMGKYIADQTVKKLILKGIKVLGAKVAILGLTFKENCRDLRNSKVIDVIKELESFGVDVVVHDPIADSTEAKRQYEINLCEWNQLEKQDAIVICVAHEQYKELTVNDYLEKLNRTKLIVDVKSILDPQSFQAHEIDLWRL